MEKDKIFFAEEGLTTTSANHVANLAKEHVQTLNTSIEGIIFYTTKISLLGSDEEKTIHVGSTYVDLEKIQPTLLEIAKCKSLIAWLREAIKAKQRLIKEATNLLSDEIAETLGIEPPKVPVKEFVPSEEDIVATWNIKQRNRYYYVETICSTVGTFIHPNGILSKEREVLKNRINEPSEVAGQGRDTVIYTYVPTVSQEQVDEDFFKLQKLYREFQAELNSMKHSIETEIQKIDREVREKYDKEFAEYTNAMKSIDIKIANYRTERIREAQNLKITIPDSLKEIFQKVNGK